MSQWIYVSSKAQGDPIRTVLLFPPATYANSIQSVIEFAEKTGWVDAVENGQAALVVATTDTHWQDMAPDLPITVYENCRNKIFKPSDGSKLWAWETMISLVGYDDGADYVCDFLFRQPGFASSIVAIGGQQRSFEALGKFTNPWFVKNPTSYQVKNSSIPFSAWFVGEKYSEEWISNLAEATKSTYRIYQDNDVITDNECRIRLSSANSGNCSIDAKDMLSFLNHWIRWKSGPDGKLRWHVTKDEFYASNRYIHDSLEIDNLKYGYSFYLPRKTAPSPISKLALVVSLHGRGEPAWIFSTKNGWEDLADETGEFAVLIPDSPGNIWVFERDHKALLHIVDKVIDTYCLDKSRIYLTGFSNGAVFTCQVASTFPEKFAGASAWNGPSLEAIASAQLGSFIFNPEMLSKKQPLPYWFAYGDSDDKASPIAQEDLKTILKANDIKHIEPVFLNSSEMYSCQKGYREPERFESTLYGSDDEAQVVITKVVNMPHGAIDDESRAAWSFLSRYKRVKGKLEIGRL